MEFILPLRGTKMKRNLILPLFILIFAILFTWLLLYPNRVNSGLYLDSAHGNTSYGVNRTSLSIFGYSIGNCAHCHEQHASIDGSEPSPVNSEPSNYLLFDENFISQSQDFCFDCHKGAGSLQVSFNRKNYNYSYWFGGDHVNHTTPDNIYDAFNYTSLEGSSHNLQDILNFVKSKWPEVYKNESNPCNACHNPHISKRMYPVVRPIPEQRNNIWGDELGERMIDFAAAHGGQYHAPYWYGSTTQYEPDGSTTTDGSNVPDYVTFCSDCHNSTNTIYSSTLGRNLEKIDWSRQSRTYLGYSNHCDNPGDLHGSIPRCTEIDNFYIDWEGKKWKACGCIKDNSYGYPSGFCNGAPIGANECCLYNGNPVPAPIWWGALKDPYKTANYSNFILNCTDCHEPHGAVHGSFVKDEPITPHLLRKTINGHYNKQCIGGPGNPCWWQEEFCRSCHYHRESTTVQIYIQEFDRTVTLNGAHCGNYGNCLNCHAHNLCAKCFSCWWCGLLGGKSPNSF